MADKVKLNKKELKELEKFMNKRIEYIVFNTKRDKKKQNGKKKIEDDSGDLRKSIKKASNFINQTNKGLEINYPTISYFKYLDDQRREELNWYLTEAIFDDDEIRDKLRELYTKSMTRAMLDILQ